MRSGPFARSPKLAGFLRFVVEEELAGRGATLKAYTIATQALGRPKDFDPGVDPSVRVEAGRLRRAIDEGYAVIEEPQPVRIRVPVGTYRPQFERVAPPEPAAIPDPAAAVPAPGPAAPGLVPPGSAAAAAGLIGFSPRAQSVIIALLASILLLLCVEVYLLIALHPIANGDDRQAQRTGVSQTIR
ncbi:hypothetical protein [Methylobacterium oryzihabitans]|uniref:Uncharacterized protein n=1 Tax=Methylobacterium oryzihabitans TaxID=2499852 RepID=A0A437PFE7_9HYPH|nr:hypothetical protein [Methylobacterium oryzihabitans]RVU21000.1 hypothetical protein EOE48_02575 [Methylobacterium oryzihabitans]